LIIGAATVYNILEKNKTLKYICCK